MIDEKEERRREEGGGGGGSINTGQSDEREVFVRRRTAVTGI